MPSEIPARMRQFYRTAATWSTLNPVLDEGEIGFISDADPPMHKVGDGLTAWNSLPFAGAAGGSKLQTLTDTRTSLADDAYANFEIAAGLVYNLLSITASHACWIRVFSSTAARTADTRTTPGAPYPDPGNGFEAEIVTTGANETVQFSPVAVCQGDGGDAFVRIQNQSGGTVNLVTEFSVLTLA